MAISASKTDALPRDLVAAREIIYQANGFNLKDPIREEESAEYDAYSFRLNGLSVRYRFAKITPKKIGQFVTLWKRVEDGTIQPFDEFDAIDLIIVGARQGQNCGQFVFPHRILCEKGIFTVNGKGGKRAMRLYPPWDRPISAQAIKSQIWQLEYFLKVPPSGDLDSKKIRALYSAN